MNTKKKYMTPMVEIMGIQVCTMIATSDIVTSNTMHFGDDAEAGIEAETKGRRNAADEDVFEGIATNGWADGGLW